MLVQLIQTWLGWIKAFAHAASRVGEGFISRQSACYNLLSIANGKWEGKRCAANNRAHKPIIYFIALEFLRCIQPMFNVTCRAYMV